LTEPTPGPITAEKKASAQSSVPSDPAPQKYAQALSQVPEFKEFGAVLKSSVKPIELTEQETEYAVTAVKHIFQEHIVFQFDIQNTLPDTILENVSMISTPDGEESGLVEDFIIPAPVISTSNPSMIYVSFSRFNPEKFDIANFSNVLKFTSKEVDPDTGDPEETGYDDEYEVDVLSLTAGDYLLPTYIGNFQGTWDSLGIHNEVSDTFALSSMTSIQEAMSALIELLSLQPLEGTDSALSLSTHTMKLSGRTIAGGKVVAIAKMAFSQKSGVTLKLSSRSQQAEAAQLVLNAVGA